MITGTKVGAGPSGLPDHNGSVGREVRRLLGQLPQDWMPEGSCVQIGGRSWDSEDSRLSDYDRMRICRDCPVQPQCLDHALQLGHRAWGVWGGTDDQLRRAIRRQGMKAAS